MKAANTFFHLATMLKSLPTVLGTLPLQSPQDGDSSQMLPLHVKPAQGDKQPLTGSAYVLRTCRPSGDMRSHWLPRTRLRGGKLLGHEFETAGYMAQLAHGASGGARCHLRSVWVCYNGSQGCLKGLQIYPGLKAFKE
jgi:hypothetical protein